MALLSDQTQGTEGELMKEIEMLRDRMIENHLKARGIQDPAVLQAMRAVPREQFVPDHLMEFAYEDAPLPIGEGQTISQPFIVASMTALLELSQTDRILEVGTGSGYAAAVLSRIAGQVFTIERHESLVASARRRFERMGYPNIHVFQGDGTMGLPDQAPFDAIVVTAGAPDVPEPLAQQLAVGGRLVIPVGADSRTQQLLRVRRDTETDYARQEIAAVRFVPLVGRAAWESPDSDPAPTEAFPSKPYAEVIAQHGDIVSSIAETDLQPLLDRVGNARTVLLGEATHGTSEFYEMRARISKELIRNKGFRILALEADWPDAAQIDRYVRGKAAEVPVEKPFQRFPTWMWANAQFADFGFGTDHGTVAAASEWDRPMEIKEIRPAHPDSYEAICHHSDIKGFILPLNHPDRIEVRHAFLQERLERAIGVIYAPRTEMQSHYFHARLPDQFDEYIWFDETHAITPLSDLRGQKFPATFPFAV